VPELIKVRKCNLAGDVTWEYEGRVLRREANAITLEALFNREDLPFMDVVLKKGDRFIETFYADRWYNVFEIHDRDDDGLKGWYCNIGRPAEIREGSVAYVDLALDLWVAVDGTQSVLDEDEFAALSLSPDIRQQARAALQALRKRFEKKSPSQQM
jgi:hypothetical protein